MNFVQPNASARDNGAGAISEIADRNAATSAAIIVGGCTAGLGGAVAVAVVPAHMTLLAGATAALAYVGDRQFKNKPINPFQKDEAKSDAKTDAKSKSVAKSDTDSNNAEAPATA